MPTYRADYEVKSSLVNPPQGAPFVIKGQEPPFEIELRNAKFDKNNHIPGLIAVVVAQAENLDQVVTSFRTLLAHQLDILSFSTHSTFEIVQCMRAMEWEPYKKTRAFKVLNTFDPLYPPIPQLNSVYANTVQAISNGKPADYVIRAMRCFRYGVLDKQPEDQFQNFWLAIEVIAEGRKPTERVPIDCPKCRKALYCASCEVHPDRRPMARQAIRQLINDIVPKKQAHEVDRVFGIVRNKLLHGSSLDTIEAEVKIPISNIVNKAGWVAWHAILSAMPESVNRTELNFGHRDGQFAHGDLVPSMIGTFEHDGQSEHPAEEKIPMIEISMQVQQA